MIKVSSVVKNIQNVEKAYNLGTISFSTYQKELQSATKELNSFLEFELTTFETKTIDILVKTCKNKLQDVKKRRYSQILIVTLVVYTISTFLLLYCSYLM